MKYAVFVMAAVGMIPLAVALSVCTSWMKYAFWCMVASMCLYQQTAINFFSNEFYHGTARGMEVSLVYLLAFAILVAFAIRGRARGVFSDGGAKLFALYFILCLPSLTQSDDLLISWLEIWKMLMIFLFYAAVRIYLKATDDINTVVKTLALFTLMNALFTAKAHYAGVYQPGGVFPHRNGMAMGMLLLGPVFFAGYLSFGLLSRRGLLYAVAFVGAVISTFWSYSRGALAMVPVAYGITAMAMLWERKRTLRKLVRILPLFAAAAVGLLAMMPRIIERFTEAPKSSGETRVELAQCAFEMISDKPWTGVGINNWSLNMEPTHPYQDRASQIVGRELAYRGIVETVYLLVCAECGIPALLAMLAWFVWHWLLSVRLLGKLRGTEWYFVAAGLCGGLVVNYAQSVLEWVLRQPLNLICLMFVFAALSYLHADWRLPETKKKASTL